MAPINAKEYHVNKENQSITNAFWILITFIFLWVMCGSGAVRSPGLAYKGLEQVCIFVHSTEECSK